jgi:hypothetical protein
MIHACIYGRCLASSEVAWHETRGRPGFIREQPMNDDLAWGTAATAGAISWVHVDDDGFGTTVIVRSGAKYWVLMRPRRDAEWDHQGGNLGSIKAYPEEWTPSRDSGKGLWEAEGLLLTEGSVL